MRVLLYFVSNPLRVSNAEFLYLHEFFTMYSSSMIEIRKMYFLARVPPSGGRRDGTGWRLALRHIQRGRRIRGEEFRHRGIPVHDRHVRCDSERDATVSFLFRHSTPASILNSGIKGIIFRPS